MSRKAKTIPRREEVDESTLPPDADIALIDQGIFPTGGQKVALYPEYVTDPILPFYPRKQMKPGHKKCQNRNCDLFLPLNADKKRDFCCKSHGNAERVAQHREKKRNDPQHQAVKQREREREQELKLVRGRLNDFSGSEGYEEFEDDGWPEKIRANALTQQEVAAEMGVTAKSISKWYDYWEAKQLAKQWGIGGVDEDWAPPEPYDPDDMVNDFILFREDNFTTETGASYTTPPHQRRWIREVYETWQEGGKLVILSPPRHGKTDLLIHFSVWLIIRFPNIRILYIGGSQEIAEYSVGSVKDHLELNENLERFKHPDKRYKPRTRSGRSWTTSKFTVGTRDIVGMKGPTMKAVGRGGRILSLDSDLIIVDDPEDHDATMNPGTREQTRGWWAKSVMSRKMEHTGVMVIGSRVHPDDLVGNLASNPDYHAIVEQVHDEALCTAAADDLEGHEHCMLWPEVRSYRWAIDKKNDPIEGEFFEMVYMNRALDADTATFKPEDIDACFDSTRGVGHLPRQTRLIAGLDPSVTGNQAAVLWAVDLRTGRRYLVDIDNRSGGGVDAALDIMQRWYKAYHLSHWVIEENLYHGAILNDTAIQKWARANYVTIEGHETWGTNKWDRHMGVTSMARYFRDEDGEGNRLISLPAADVTSRELSSEYRKQLLNFNRDVAARSNNGTRSRKAKSDIVMAAWFPEAAIKRWNYEAINAVNYTYNNTQYPFTRMGYGSSGLFSKPPPKPQRVPASASSRR